MFIQRVRRLSAGSRVAIVSPSWGGPSVFPDVFDLGLANLRQMGLVPIEFPTARMSNDVLHKNPRLRADDLHSALLDKYIDGVIASIGGDDCIRILEFLQPKILKLLALMVSKTLLSATGKPSTWSRASHGD